MKQIKYITQIFLIAFLFPLIQSCEMKKEILDDQDTKTSGQWLLSVKADTDISALQAVTRANESVNVDDFSVSIYDQSDVLVASYNTFKELKEAGTIILSKGNYRVNVSSGEMKEAAFEEPNYASSELFEIEPRKITRTDLVCDMQNVKVTVECSDLFNKYFKPDYAVNVTNGKGILNFSNKKNVAGYFKPSDLLQMRVVATSLDGERIITQTFDLNEKKANGKAEAKDYFRVVLDIKEQVGSAQMIQIDADYTVNTKDQIVLVPTEPEIPTPDPGITGEGPILTATGFTFGTPIVFSEADETYPTVIVDIDATKGNGLKHLFVDITSDYLIPLLPFKSLPIDLANLSEADEAIVDQLGLPTDVINKTNVQVDISNFMGPLALGNGTTNFIIKAVDNSDKETQKTIITTVIEN